VIAGCCNGSKSCLICDDADDASFGNGEWGITWRQNSRWSYYSLGEARKIANWYEDVALLIWKLRWRHFLLIQQKLAEIRKTRPNVIQAFWNVIPTSPCNALDFTSLLCTVCDSINWVYLRFCIIIKWPKNSHNQRNSHPRIVAGADCDYQLVVELKYLVASSIYGTKVMIAVVIYW